jgi:Short-chain alcohol dehydrogenase of unknown specificity
MKKIALITGATSGIGAAVAHALAKVGYDLVITGRREDPLMNTAKRLGDKYEVKVLPLNFDVRNQADVEKYLGNLPKEWQNIDVLVNNAGLAVGLDPIYNGVVDDWERMIDTNIKGLLYVSRVVSALMAERGKGHIINIGSIAGKSVYPNGNVYCATKYAVDAISKGMMMDLNDKNIKVSQVCPGAVETEFSEVRFKGDTERAANVYKGFVPLKADDVADVIKYMVTAPEHVNLADVVILPSAQAAATMIRKK